MLTNPWPDYVFDDGYELLSLSALAQYVEHHKHLPEVPTAEEVEQNGVSLGEMNSILLKKMEELTLYVLELKKENDEARAAMRIMEAKINLLQTGK